MGCSPSHALIINSSRTHAEPLCLQPRIYMVSESTLRILQDVGELRLYQQEDKDPGVARVRFGANTLDQLENPVGYQTQVGRQLSIDSEQGVTVSREDSKVSANLETAQEQNEDVVGREDSVSDHDEEQEGSSGLRRLETSQSSNSSSSTLIVAQIHNPLTLKSIAKGSVSNEEDSNSRPESPDSRTNLTQSTHSSCTNLQENRTGGRFGTLRYNSGETVSLIN